MSLASPLTAMAMLCACSNSQRVAEENDRLRRERFELTQQVEELRGRVDELETALATEAARPDAPAPEVVANTPRVVRISISRLSHFRDEDDDGELDTLMIFINTEDSRARFVQIVGTFEASAWVLPQGGEAAAVGHASFDPAAVRDAYRAGITGVHYSFELPVGLPAGARDVAVRVAFTDGLSGRELRAERTIQIRQP